jgi:accessory gene regulator protein AgrB
METQVNNTTITPRSVGTKYGLISSLLSILFFLTLSVTGQNAFDNSWSWIGIVISVTMVVLAHKKFMDSGNGFMSYGQGVGIAFWIALISVAISFVITFLYVAAIDTGAMDLFYEKQTEQMSRQGMADEQIDMAIGLMKSLFWPIYIFVGLFLGVLIGVIVSIFTQKKNQEPSF